MLSHWHAYFCCLDIVTECGSDIDPQALNWFGGKSTGTVQCTDDEYLKLMPLRNPESLPLSNCA